MSQSESSRRPDLGTIIAALHDSEINGEVSWLYDGVWRVKLGDEANGFDAEAVVASPGDAAEWLRANAVSIAVPVPSRLLESTWPQLRPRQRNQGLSLRRLSALTQNDAAIEGAIDPMVQRGLVADKLLVLRNFAGAVIASIASYGRIALSKVGTELGEPVSRSLEAIKEELPKGFGALARVGPLLLLADHLHNPYAQIALGVAAFSPVAGVLRKTIAAKFKNSGAGRPAGFAGRGWPMPAKRSSRFRQCPGRETVLCQ